MNPRITALNPKTNKADAILHLPHLLSPKRDGINLKVNPFSNKLGLKCLS